MGRGLWDNLKHIGSNMQEPWCVVKNVSVVFLQRERVEGIEVSAAKLMIFGHVLAFVLSLI